MNIELARKNIHSTDDDDVVASLRALGQDGGLTDLQTVLGHVKSENPHVKVMAIEAACSLIRNNLIAYFDRLAPEIRKKLGVLMESLDPLIIDEIAGDLRSEDDNVRVRAIQILGLLKKNPKIRELIAKLVQDRNEKIRATAIILLGKVIGANDHDLLLSLLNDPDKRVRANTVEALESVGNKRVIPILLRYHKDPNNRIRGNVIKALFTLGHNKESIEEDLLEMLNSADNLMKASALWVVAQIKLSARSLEDSAGFHLLAENEMVKNNAKMALQVLDSPRSLGYIRYLDTASVS
jgi:HEAT repeat protein